MQSFAVAWNIRQTAGDTAPWRRTSWLTAGAALSTVGLRTVTGVLNEFTDVSCVLHLFHLMTVIVQAGVAQSV